MFPVERKNRIKEELLATKTVSVTTLAAKFNVTEETIRRDLKILEEEGFAEKIHGGAIIADRTVSPFNRTMMKNILPESKQEMSKLVRPFIKNGHCLYLDSSTTVQYILPLLSDIQVTIASNASEIQKIAADMDNIQLIGLGGVYNHHFRCYTGSITKSVLENFFFDISIISCRTLGLEEGLCDSDSEDACIKQLALNRSKKKILLADHTKFNKQSFVKVCDVKDIDILITDEKLPDAWEKFLIENGIEFFYPEQKN